MPLHRDPRERLDAIERELDRDNIDSELRDEIEAVLPDVYTEYVTLQSEMGFEKHMSKYVSEAYNERQNGTRGPLCTCSLPTCPLTNGTLPAKVRYNPDAVFSQTDGRKRVLQWVQKHTGAEVLHEMIEAWDQREGELRRQIGQIHTRLLKDRSDNLREVPTEQP